MRGITPKLVSLGASMMNHFCAESLRVSASYSLASGGSELKVSTHGESELCPGDSGCAASESCCADAPGADCDPLSACPSRIAAATAQQGNNAVLSQNATQPNINAMRANPRRLDVGTTSLIKETFVFAMAGLPIYIVCGKTRFPSWMHKPSDVHQRLVAFASNVDL